MKRNKITNILMNIKVYWGRTTTYLALTNSAMILYLTLNRLEDNGMIPFQVDKYIAQIIILGVFVLILVGFIETKLLGANQEEKSINFNLTPEFVEMKSKIEKIYHKLNNETKRN